jgi:hypothetical protein
MRFQLGAEPRGTREASLPREDSAVSRDIHSLKGDQARDTLISRERCR